MKNEMIQYEKPEMEIVRFQTTNIVRTSGDNDNTKDDPFGDW